MSSSERAVWWKTLGTNVYGAFGMVIFKEVVPTAATAGLLTVLVRTVDAWPWSGGDFTPNLLLGWFAVMLFIVSTGHGDKHHNDKNPVGVIFDLLETALMFLAFHSLGLVTGKPPASNQFFFLWLALYLLSIFGRRYVNRKMQVAGAHALDGLKSDLGIRILSGSVFVGAAAIFGWYFRKTGDLAAFERPIALALLCAVTLYVGLSLWRQYEMQKPKSTG
jgi:hypothetical protein